MGIDDGASTVEMSGTIEMDEPELRSMDGDLGAEEDNAMDCDNGGGFYE